MVGTVTGETRYIETHLLRRFFFDRHATAVSEPDVLGVGFCAICPEGACVVGTGNGVGFLRRATALIYLSFTTFQCHRFIAPSASVSSKCRKMPLRSSADMFVR